MFKVKHRMAFRFKNKKSTKIMGLRPPMYWTNFFSRPTDLGALVELVGFKGSEVAQIESPPTTL